ncbi:MAG: hypothetical protein QXT48_04580, partial [Thermoplasmatales archaeon]
YAVSGFVLGRPWNVKRPKRHIMKEYPLASRNLDSLIQVSFKCNKELYELLNDESMKKKSANCNIQG